MIQHNPTRVLLLSTLGLLAACGDLDVASDTGTEFDTDTSRDVGIDTGGSDATDATGADASTDADSTVIDDADTTPGIDAAETDSGPGNDAHEACRLAFTEGTYVGIGFPRAPERLHTTGTIVGTVLFVQFTDVTADRTPQDVMDILSPDAEDFYHTVSYGQTELELRPHLQWLDMSGDAARYAASLGDFYLHRDFVLEAVELADADVDFSETDIIVVMATPNADAITFGPTWMGDFNAPIVADGRTITNGVTSGADLLYWGGTWLNHEMGHSMNLPDLYSFAAPTGFARPFSAMDLINSEAPEFLAWERWQLDWLADTQIVCEPMDGEYTLEPIETVGGTKALMVAVSDTRLVVVESRRALGLDSGLTTPGALVYTVDSTIATGQGPIRVLNGQQTLVVGESVETDGVRVEVVSADDNGDTVRVTRL